MAQLWLTTVACNLLKSWLVCNCRRVLKHVSKSYNFFRVVCNSLGKLWGWFTRSNLCRMDEVSKLHATVISQSCAVSCVSDQDSFFFSIWHLAPNKLHLRLADPIQQAIMSLAGTFCWEPALVVGEKSVCGLRLIRMYICMMLTLFCHYRPLSPSPVGLMALSRNSTMKWMT